MSEIIGVIGIWMIWVGILIMEERRLKRMREEMKGELKKQIEEEVEEVMKCLKVKLNQN